MRFTFTLTSFVSTSSLLNSDISTHRDERRPNCSCNSRNKEVCLSAVVFWFNFFASSRSAIALLVAINANNEKCEQKWMKFSLSTHSQVANESTNEKRWRRWRRSWQQKQTEIQKFTNFLKFLFFSVEEANVQSFTSFLFGRKQCRKIHEIRLALLLAMRWFSTLIGARRIRNVNAFNRPEVSDYLFVCRKEICRRRRTERCNGKSCV